MNTPIILGITFGYIVYFCLTFLWLNRTLNYKYTLNHYAFKFELQKPRRSLMFYVEAAMVILLLIGFLTTLISEIQIQISIHRKKK